MERADDSVVKAARRAMKRVTRAWRSGVVERTPAWARTAFGPTARYLDMLFVDHGVFRLLYINRHRLSPTVWRSAQPAPHHIQHMATEGIKTIVNLRGASDSGSYYLEQDACRRLGITLVDFPVRSRAAPTRAELSAARQLFERVDYPMLMHCKSGSDRAGLMSVLYAHWKLGQPIEQARRQLAFKYGHIRQADTGVLGRVFDTYLADNAREPISFADWVDTRYDPDAIKRDFISNSLANRIVNTVLRRE
jgi:protein tyrosine phosphatase (PTP) superfamily phosphohydrolase (DUF442 family)